MIFVVLHGIQNNASSQHYFKAKVWFPSEHNGIVKSYDSSRFLFIVDRLITIENKTLTEIGSGLQAKRFLS